MLAAGVLLGATGVLGACSDVPDALNPVSWWDGVFGDDEDAGPPPTVKTATGTAAAPAAQTQTAQASGTPPASGNGGQPYPALQQVPDQPATSTVEQRRQMMQGLSADRANAKYADESARAADAAQAAPAAGASSTPAAAPAASAPAPAASASDAGLSPETAPEASMAPPASSAESAAPSKKMESAGSNMTPPPAPPTPGKKSYMSGLDSDTDTGSTPPAEPAAPAKKGAKAKSAAKSPAPAATPAPAAAEGVTPEAPGSAELKNTYESKLKESAPTVSTAPAGPTAAGAPPSAAAVAEPPAMAEAPPASQGSLAFGKSAGPSVQVFDSGMPGGSDMSMAAPGQIGTVYFGSGSAELDEQDIAKLREVAAAYKQRGGNIRVVGYASSYTRDMDPVHHQMVNFTVSMRRADAVARELARLGVKPASIFVTALSDSEPVYYESMPAGRAGNQRAEIFIDY